MARNRRPQPVGFFSRGKGRKRKVIPITPPQHRRIRRVHAQRSPVARRTDEALRAPIAPSAGHWERTPNRLDVERVDYGKIKRRRKLKDKEVVFDVERQKEILKPTSKTRATRKREKAPTKTKKTIMEKDFDRWLEKSEKTKGKARYEIIVGDTVSGVVTSNLAEAEQQMKKLRRDRPSLRRMRIVKVQHGTYVTVKREKRTPSPGPGLQQ